MKITFLIVAVLLWGCGQHEDGEDGETIIGPQGESVTGPSGQPGESVVGPRGEVGQVGAAGGQGQAGVDGTPATPCTVVQVDENTATFVCPDGSTATLKTKPPTPCKGKKD